MPLTDFTLTQTILTFNFCSARQTAGRSRVSALPDQRPAWRGEQSQVQTGETTTCGAEIITGGVEPLPRSHRRLQTHWALCGAVLLSDQVHRLPQWEHLLGPLLGPVAGCSKIQVCLPNSTQLSVLTNQLLIFDLCRSRVDIEECLAAFTEQETLDGNEQPVWETCRFLLNCQTNSPSPLVLFQLQETSSINETSFYSALTQNTNYS